MGGDLTAVARLDAAAARHGITLRTAAAGAFEQALREGAPDLVVLDLDAGGEPLLEELVRARAAGLLRGRVVGYFSHVDEGLGRNAAAAGCEALARGRFWRTLDEVFAGVAERR